MYSSIFQRMPEALISWYSHNHRDLPWRRDKNPYHIWISEIMLQQTRVEAVKGYYNRFLNALPDIASLAACEDDALNKLWEGLGYYNRARNLKKAAQLIINQYDGIFPKAYEDILGLPGIGEYTAGAICSIAYDMPVAAVDGNVMRVISRLTDDTTPIDQPAYKKSVKCSLEAVYPRQAGLFTQAIMELGATVCGPNRTPDCAHCPCSDFCLAAKRGTAKHLPVKSPKKEKRQEDKTVLILKCGNKYALCKRKDRGLLAGLWQFPNCPDKLSLNGIVSELEKKGVTVTEVYKTLERDHIFTHIKWNMRGYFLEVREEAGEWCWFTEAEISANAALPTAFRKFWDLRNS